MDVSNMDIDALMNELEKPDTSRPKSAKVKQENQQLVEMRKLMELADMISEITGKVIEAQEKNPKINIVCRSQNTEMANELFRIALNGNKENQYADASKAMKNAIIELCNKCELHNKYQKDKIDLSSVKGLKELTKAVK